MLTLSRSTTSLGAPLLAAKGAAKDRVNEITDEVRRLFITPIAGQEMIYLNKEQEAQRFLAETPEPTDLSEYPFLAAEVGSTGATAVEVATIFVTRGAQWRAIGSMIERLRVQALTDIAAATDEAGVAAAVSAFALDMEELR